MDHKPPPFPRYTRKGQCVRCGACCLTEDCEHLEIYDDWLANCLIYHDPTRPLKCKLFPSNPPILFIECGYYFIDTWEDNKKIMPGEGLG